MIEVVTRFKKKRIKLSSKDYRSLHKKILSRDGYRCVLCGSMKNLSIDHIVKRSQQGDDTEDNLRTLCTTCHDKEDNTIFSQKRKDQKSSSLHQTSSGENHLDN